MDAFIESIKAEPLQLLIPLFSALIGYITNVLAVKMMFKPVDFVGLPPYLGWQGIIPANALRLANTGLKLVMDKILSIKELFIDFSADEFVGGQSDRIDELTRNLIEEKAQAHFGPMWAALAPDIREQVITTASAEIRTMSVEVFQEAKRRRPALHHVRTFPLPPSCWVRI